MLRRATYFAVAVVVAGTASAAEVGTGPLADRNAQLPAISTQSLHAFKPEASGAISRTLFDGPGPAGSTLTVREILVGPRASQQLAALPGPSILRWLEGRGTFSVGSGVQQPISDLTAVVPAGQTLTIRNLAPAPISVRIYEFAAGNE